MTYSLADEVERDRLGTWCGWVLVGGAVLIPPMAWAAPNGFAALMALLGLLMLPAIRMADEDRPGLIVLFAALIWAAVSTAWSPFHPAKLGQTTALKLALQLPLYYAAICGARRADPVLRARAMSFLAWGLGAFSVVMIVEALSGARIYRGLLEVIGDPLRPDLAQKNLGQSSFAFALLWPLAVLGAPEVHRGRLALVMGIGVLAVGLAFRSDAPVLSLMIGALVFFAMRRCPAWTPRIIAIKAAVLFLAAPVLVWAVRSLWDFSGIEAHLPLSWAIRMGYWSHAVDWIAQQPLRGWGLDASRMFAPGIQLHPHDGPLQVWLELGLIGAVSGAAFWGLTLMRLSRPTFQLPATAAASRGNRN